ncbi:DNA-binding transcriptional LysR family regulator [Alkalibaculum bacchi]|mgnify:CR=1 FL=1|uniref:DNA-binding transcriptional LysR family regulator n=1 Tax=Alkalibaculum bacchi TaxID=645887 RepID=A0A366I712_9FIRM|nr:LysR family transcriptional regulator [Alkalibaculum bacchi]RBP63810.1 DNA-binding transcriptional LysR family regulator [Alkalibaculum bacchi]
MTIRHLKIFIEVAQCGKMRSAAERLFVSQPTISQAIRELEQHYGVLLFQRIKKRLYITDEGKQLLFYAKDVVEQFDHLEEKMFNLSRTEKVKIGATVTVGECILSDIINQFKIKEPTVEVYSYANNTERIEEKLLNGEIDIGIIEGKIKSPNLISIPKIKDYLVLVCSNQHPFAKKDVINLKELANKSFAMREKGSGTRELFEEYMIKNKVPIKTVFEGNSPESIKREVVENNCLAVISIGLVQKEVQDSKIHIIKNANEGWNRYFSVVYHKDKELTDKIRCIIDIINNYKYLQNYPKFQSGMLINETS